MEDAVLREKVDELLTEVHYVPRAARPARPVGGPAGPAQATGVRREMAILEDTLDQVRLAIKYLVFDLEATKRENRLLREMMGDA
jgi:hypothetical protein